MVIVDHALCTVIPVIDVRASFRYAVSLANPGLHGPAGVRHKASSFVTTTDALYFIDGYNIM